MKQIIKVLLPNKCGMTHSVLTWIKFLLEVSPKCISFMIYQRISLKVLYIATALVVRKITDENMVGCFFTHALHSYIGL